MKMLHIQTTYENMVLIDHCHNIETNLYFGLSEQVYTFLSFIVIRIIFIFNFLE